MIAPGFTAEDYEDEEDAVCLWPENEAAYALFRAVETQWAYVSVGMTAVRVGLRYEAVYPVMDRVAKTPEEWNELFRDLRVMEAAAVNECAKHTSGKS